MVPGRVSVVIPCFNGEEFLEAALRSVLWQTYGNWECITVDDGSTDRSAAILQEYARRDPRFVYLRQENKGPAAARNAGIARASGEFIQLLDDDDIIPEERLELCIAHFRAHPEADVVYTDYITYQRGGGFVRTLPAKIPSEDVLRAFLFEQNETFATIVHSFLFKRTLIAAHPFDTTLHSHAEDVECWIRLAAAGAKFSYLDTILAVYRFSPGTLASRESVLLSAKINVLHRYERDLRFARYRHEFARAINYLEQRLAMGLFMEKAFRKGWHVMMRQWSDARPSARAKMAGWGFLMMFFTKDQVANIRAWIVGNTPIRWGGWVHYKTWTPPESIRALLDA